MEGESSPLEVNPLRCVPPTSSHGEPQGSSSKSCKRKTKGKKSVAGLGSAFGISPAERAHGNQGVVNRVLMEYDALRRKIVQLRDAGILDSKEHKRPDLKAGNLLMTEGIQTNKTKRVGHIPGVEIGDIFFYRMELCIVGLHSPNMGGIDYMKVGPEEKTLAVSIVSSYGYDDYSGNDDTLIYSGQSGTFGKKGKAVADQKLETGNLALQTSLKEGNKVRVTRGLKYAGAKVYVYDGLYEIRESWTEKDKHDRSVFKYKLVRVPGQLSALSVWKSIENWKRDPCSRIGLILSDLSSGSERIPVAVFNDVDKEISPGNFSYFGSLRNSKPLQSFNGCSCTESCVPGDLNCSCIQRNQGHLPYTGNGILVNRKALVHECGPACKCFPTCKNRVTQMGVIHALEVFRTRGRGWGLRSWNPIPAGSFICQYAGEVLDAGNSKQTEELAHAFHTNRFYPPFKWNHTPQLLKVSSNDPTSEDYDIAFPLVISAEEYGNVARFMNHSCSPNIFWQPVVFEENHQSFLHIAFFSLRHIPPMTELTYDYGISPKCLCGSSNCRGSFG